MMRLFAAAVTAVILQTSPTFAGGLAGDVAKDLPSVEVVTSIDDGSHGNLGQPSLSSSDIAAIQFHEPQVGAVDAPAARTLAGNIGSED